MGITNLKQYCPAEGVESGFFTPHGQGSKSMSNLEPTLLKTGQYILGLIPQYHGT